jgi:hypothetical protein
MYLPGCFACLLSETPVPNDACMDEVSSWVGYKDSEWGSCLELCVCVGGCPWRKNILFFLGWFSLAPLLHCLLLPAPQVLTLGPKEKDIVNMISLT